MSNNLAYLALGILLTLAGLACYTFFDAILKTYNAWHGLKENWDQEYFDQLHRDSGYVIPAYQPISREEMADLELEHGRTFTEREAYEMLRLTRLEGAYRDMVK